MPKPNQQTPPNTAKHNTLPATRKTTFIEWARDNHTALLSGGASFVPPTARERMLKKNIEYILSADLKDAWNHEDGVLSIQKALEDSLYYAATMPETGSLLPFKTSAGYIVEFCAGIDCFRSALTTGEKAPCSFINIECIYKNDKYDIVANNNKFEYSNKPMLPRDDIIGVIVQVIYKNGDSIGKLYGVGELMEKAAEHSASYKYYLKDIADLRKAQSEGKDYIVKWEKKVYEKDITSPYAGADREKMLIKLAGKSFLRPLFKQLMINCIIDENEKDEAIKKEIASTPLQIINKSIDHVKNDLSAGKSSGAPLQIENENCNLQDAEIIDDTPSKQPEKSPAQKPAKKRSDLFGD